MDELGELGDFERREALRRATLTPADMRVVLWGAVSRIQELKKMDAFVGDYIGGMLQVVDGMQEAADVLDGELPDGEVPRARLEEAISTSAQAMDVRYGIPEIEVLSSLDGCSRCNGALHARAARMMVDRHLGYVYAAYQEGRLPTDTLGDVL